MEKRNVTHVSLSVEAQALFTSRPSRLFSLQTEPQKKSSFSQTKTAPPKGLRRSWLLVAVLPVIILMFLVGAVLYKLGGH